jgi:hypothetical protein
MATEATPVIGPSRPRLVGDVLWLGFTAFVFAVILVIVCWPLSAALSVHNPPDAAANQPTAGLTTGTSEFRHRGTPAGSRQRRSDCATRRLADAGGRGWRGIEQCRAVLPDRYTGRSGWSQSDAPRPLAAGRSSCIGNSGGK